MNTRMKVDSAEAVVPDYSVSDVCHIFNVTPPTVYRLIRVGKVAAYKVGNKTRISRESVDLIRSTPAPMKRA
jgi:excisionase family DNA binding protein